MRNDPRMLDIYLARDCDLITETHTTASRTIAALPLPPRRGKDLYSDDLIFGTCTNLAKTPAYCNLNRINMVSSCGARLTWNPSAVDMFSTRLLCGRASPTSSCVPRERQ